MGPLLFGSAQFILFCYFSTAVLSNIKIFLVFIIIQNTIYKLPSYFKFKKKTLSYHQVIPYIQTRFFYCISSTIIYFKNIIHPRKLAKWRRDKIGF